MYHLLEIAFVLIGPAAVMLALLARRPRLAGRILIGTTTAIIAPIVAGWASYQDTLLITPCRLREQEAYLISCIGPQDASSMAATTGAFVIASEIAALCLVLLLLLMAIAVRHRLRTIRS